MIAANEFCEILLKRGYDYFTGVPCSYFQGVFNFCAQDARMKYVGAANEGASLGLAAGAYLAGRRPAVLLQNSGLGNLINPLTSLHAVYRLPALLLVSGRGYGVADEPQHELMGRCMNDLLRAMGIPHWDCPDGAGEFSELLDVVSAGMADRRIPHALLIRKNTIGDFPLAGAPATNYPLARREAIRIVTENLAPGSLIVATTGMPSRELLSLRDHPGQLYLMGSLGHAMAVGCGLATELPESPVVVLDGDGSALMHLGSLSTIGHCAPPNYLQVVLDNESYESTGNQDTTSRNTRFDDIARACGFKWALRCEDGESLRRALAEARTVPGPRLIHVKVGRHSDGRAPRVTDRYEAPQIAERFRDHLRGADPEARR